MVTKRKDETTELVDQCEEILKTKGDGVRFSELVAKTRQPRHRVHWAVRALKQQGRATTTGWAKGALWHFREATGPKASNGSAAVSPPPKRRKANGSSVTTRAPRQAAHVARSPAAMGDEALRAALRTYMQSKILGILDEVLAE